MPGGLGDGIGLRLKGGEKQSTRATQMPQEVPNAYALRFIALLIPGDTQGRPLGIRGARILPCGMLHERSRCKITHWPRAFTLKKNAFQRNKNRKAHPAKARSVLRAPVEAV